MACQLGSLDLSWLVRSSDQVELLVGGVIVARAWEQHEDWVEGQRKNLAAEINNAIVKAFGG